MNFHTRAVAGPTWYVVRTHPQSEIKALANLARQEFGTYLPTCRQWRKHARRRELVRRPLFPSYLFVSFDIERSRWRSVFSTFGVASLICSGEVPARVPDGTVEAIKAAEATGQFDYSNQLAQLKPGDQVKVASGPFADLVGRLQSHVSHERVRVLLEILGRQAPTELAVSQLEAV